MNKFLFTERQINVAAILAGPIPPGILIYLNYKRLGKEQEALISLAVTLVFTISFFYFIMTLPEEITTRIPSFVYTLFYGVLVYTFFRFYMAEEIATALETDFARASNWAVFRVTVLGLLVNLVIIFWMASFQPPFPGEKLALGENEIYYEEPVTQLEAEKLGQQLYSYAYFNDENPTIVHIKMVEGRYRVTLPIDKAFWEDDETVNMLTGLKQDMQTDFGGPTDVVVEHYNLNGEIDRRGF